MQFGDPLSVSSPSDTQLVIERAFVAPPHLVYACYTQPSLIRRWLTGPDGWTMPVCTYDARDGGAYRFEWHGPDNFFLAVDGAITRINAIRYIDATERFEAGEMGPPYRSELEFRLLEHGTLVVNSFTYESMEHRDFVVSTGMSQGMEFSFKSLDRLLVEEQA